MQDHETADSLRAKLDALQADYQQLSLAHKKVVRQLDLAQKQIQRNKAAEKGKDSLSRVIAAKRSELERYMDLLLGNSPDIILLFDREGNIAYATDSFLRRCGLPGFGVLRGASCEAVFAPYTTPAFRDRMCAVFARVYREKQAIGFSDTVSFVGDGSSRSYNIQVTPMQDAQGAVAGAMAILTDTTDILMAQREAERANAAKSDFLATVSHEIRTPMNAIIGIARMLKSTPLSAQQHEYLRNIEDSSMVLLNLINDILDFSRIEAGKLELVPEYFRLPGLLSHLKTMFELMFQQKGLAFFCDFAPDLPEVVLGDEKRLSQVLTNILNNALKYTERGEVRFSAFRRPDGRLGFSIADTGLGIREEALPRIFSAFERLDVTRNRSIVGTGLGLAITRRLSDLMDGDIQVDSTYGEGSRFTVSLPLPTGTPADLPPEERREIRPFKAPGAKALLVDDIEINLEIATYSLALFEMDIDAAGSGAEAVRMATEKQYDIIFMDHMMPEMDGVEATALLRAQGGHNAVVPIVALTANAVSGAVEMFYRSGFNDFLGKPIDEAALVSCLLRWLPPEKVILL